MKIKIENVGYLEVPDNTPPEEVSAAVRRIAAQQGKSEPGLKEKAKNVLTKGKEVAEGVGAVTGQALTGLPSMVAAGYAGLARLATTGSVTKAAQTQEKVSQKLDKVLNYHPKSELGKKIAEAPAKAITAVTSIPENVKGVRKEILARQFGSQAVESVQDRETLANTLDKIASEALLIMGPMALKRPVPSAVIPPKVNPPGPTYTPKLKAKTTAKMKGTLPKKADAFDWAEYAMGRSRKTNPKQAIQYLESVGSQQAKDAIKLIESGKWKRAEYGGANPFDRDKIYHYDEYLQKQPKPEAPPKPVQSEVKPAGPSLNAEQLSILDAFEGGGAKEPPVLKPGAKGKELLFFDFDGVLNKGDGLFNPENIANANKILDKHLGARIVVTSSQRIGETIEQLEGRLVQAGLHAKHRVIGKTGTGSGSDSLAGDGIFKAPRGNDIDEYLTVHGPSIGKNLKILVLDDRTDMGKFGEYLVNTKFEAGLQAEHVAIAEQILAKQGIKKGLPNAAKAKGKQKVQPALSPGPGAQAAGVDQVPPSITQLRNALGGIPRTSMASRMAVATEVAGAGRTFTSKLGAGLESVKAGMAGLWDAYTRPPVVSSFKGALGEYLYARLKFQTEGRSFAKEVKVTIGDKSRREAITNWIQAEGDDAVLSEWAAATKDPQLRKGYELAKTLTPEEKVFAGNVKSYFEDALDQLMEAGILQGGVENYINQLWKNTTHGKKLKAQLNAGLLGTNPTIIKKRILSSYFEGEQLGLKPVDKDVGFLLTAYDQSIKEMLAARTFVSSLSRQKARDGRPLVVTSGAGKVLESDAAVPEAYIIRPSTHPNLYKKNPETGKREIVDDTHDYRRIDHPALRKYKWVEETDDGIPILLQGDMLVHPEIAATFAERFSGEGYYAMQNLFGTSAIAKNPLGRVALRGLGEFKRTLLSLSGFHQVQVGIHAVFHNVSPVKAPKINLDDAVTVRGVKNGLMITDHSALAEFSEGVGGHSGLVARMPVVGPLMRRYEEYLFQDYIPRLKVAMYREAYERNIGRYPKLNEDQIAEITAHQANAAFGELNYKWLGRNKTFQDSLRLLFLAPDFLEARTKFVAQALTPTGKEQLAALVRGTAELYIGARIANYFVNDGDWKWDKPFSLVVGKKEYALRTVPGDIAHLFQHPRSFVYWRLNPGGVRPMVEWATGKDALGQTRTPKLEVMDFIKSGVPIPIQGFMKNPNDTFAESLITSSLQSLGINSYADKSSAEKIAAEAAGRNIPREKQTPESRARARLIRGLRDDIEEQPTGVPESLKKAVVDGKITATKAVSLLEERGMTQLERSFSRLRVPSQIDDIERIYKAATDEEKEIIKPIMRKKVLSFFERGSRAERDAYRDRLMPYLKE